ncbi:MAG: phytoene desaturase family protein [Bacteroidia bacterium]
MTKRVLVIGSGFAGLSAACGLAKKGYDVTVLEKNEQAGGRARKFEHQGFVFDMGPSWYWMPDVFESFFNRFDKSVKDYYELVRLDPSYQVIFGTNDTLELPASMKQLEQVFESIEVGSAIKLRAFLEEARYKYEVGINDLVYRPGLSLREFADARLLSGIFRLDVFKSMHNHVRRYFKHPKLIELMEFPVLFLGETAKNTPALYSLMNYADLALGTWYPKGGMHQIVLAMEKLARELGVKFQFHAPVEKINVENGEAVGVTINGKKIDADLVVAGADYHHVEQKLLAAENRRYSDDYWKSRKLAPSSLIFYLGISKRIPKLLHHNLFFDESFEQHAHEIYENPQWPSKPLFYVSAPSKTDSTVAPDGCENLFLLIPVAPGLEDNEALREKYYHQIMERLEKHTGVSIRDAVVFKRSYAHTDFISDYNAFRGNAYGLANTLKQTAILKPSMKSKKIKNLYFTGQLTVPGPGVPPSLISGLVVTDLIARENIVNAHEATI